MSGYTTISQYIVGYKPSVLFLDELPEYHRDVLEALRQPMEDGFVTVTRVNATSTYPSRFMRVQHDPCPCGNLGSRTKPCRCTTNEIRRYLNSVSGPLLDRIDMHIEVESIPAERLADAELSESSDAIRAAWRPPARCSASATATPASAATPS